MPLPEETQKIIYKYCEKHLPKFNWYENYLSFIKDKKLKHRIINEFKSLRFFHKLYEGIQAKDENKIFEIRYQIIGYASIYEIILNYFLSYYYSKNTLNSKKFHEKCDLAKTDILYKLKNGKGEYIDIFEDIKEIYRYRNGVHIAAEQNKNIKYELELSRKAYRRIKPFFEQIGNKLKKDNKI